MDLSNVKSIVRGGATPLTIKEAYINNKLVWPIDNTEEEVMSHLFGWWDASNLNNYKLNTTSFDTIPSNLGSKNLTITPLDTYYTINNGIGYSLNYTPMSDKFELDYDEKYVSVEYMSNGGMVVTMTLEDSLESVFTIYDSEDCWFEILILSPTAGSSSPWFNTVANYKEFNGNLSSNHFTVKAGNSLVINKVYLGTEVMVINYGSSTPDYDYITIASSLSYTGSDFPTWYTIFALIDDQAASYSATLGCVNFYGSGAGFPSSPIVVDGASNVKEINSNGIFSNCEYDGMSSISPTISLITHTHNWLSGSLGILKCKFIIVFDTVLTDEQKLWVYNNMIKK